MMLKQDNHVFSLCTDSNLEIGRAFIYNKEGIVIFDEFFLLVFMENVI